MKFLTKINRNYLIPFIIVLLAVTAAGYFILRIIITQGAKERLLSKEYLVERQVKNTGEIPNLHPVIEVHKAEKEPDILPLFKKMILILKEFTENASHEIQTPLSIALMNLEEILQHDTKEELHCFTLRIKS